MIKRKSPTRGNIMSGSPWALISIFPAAFQRRLGHSPSDRGHQALRYRSKFIIAIYNKLSIHDISLHFSISHGSPWALDINHTGINYANETQT